MSKLLIILGLVLVGVGLVWHYFPAIFQWIGHLPGDLKWKSGNVSVSFPIVSCLLLSLILSLLFWILRR